MDSRSSARCSHILAMSKRGRCRLRHSVKGRSGRVSGVLIFRRRWNGRARGGRDRKCGRSRDRAAYLLFASRTGSGGPENGLRDGQPVLVHGKDNPHCRGMGTTCTALAIYDDQEWLGHVGDSRAYLLRNGSLTQLTEDQTLYAQMIRVGLMTEDEAEAAGGRNVLAGARHEYGISTSRLRKRNSPSSGRHPHSLLGWTVEHG
jgi:hypothetical protein